MKERKIMKLSTKVRKYKRQQPESYKIFKTSLIATSVLVIGVVVCLLMYVGGFGTNANKEQAVFSSHSSTSAPSSTEVSVSSSSSSSSSSVPSSNAGLTLTSEPPSSVASNDASSNVDPNLTVSSNTNSSTTAQQSNTNSSQSQADREAYQKRVQEQVDALKNQYEQSGYTVTVHSN